MAKPSREPVRTIEATTEARAHRHQVSFDRVLNQYRDLFFGSLVDELESLKEADINGLWRLTIRYWVKTLTMQHV